MKNLVFFLLLLPFFTNAQVILTAAGNGIQGYDGVGVPATDAKLYSPCGVALDAAGNLYICDLGSSTVRKVSPAYGGNITTVVGIGSYGYSGDGSYANAARLNGVNDLAIDKAGNLYLADALNNRIRKVTTDGIINTIAGTGTAGYNGDGIPATAAELNLPYGVTVDDTGNVYIADSYNYRIRKIDTFGVISTVVGIGVSGYSEDGGMADTTKVHHPMTLTFDRLGNLYFIDSTRVRKMDVSGNVSTVAGVATFGYSGDGGAATAAELIPAAIALDTSGSLYIADVSNHRIRKVSNTEGVSIIKTIVGTGVGGYSGDGGNPIFAKIHAPSGVVVNPAGDIYIGDLANNRVRVVSSYLSASDNLGGEMEGMTVFPNPSSHQCTITVSVPDAPDIELTITDISGREVYRHSVATKKPVVVVTDWSPGVYIVSASAGQYQFSQKLVIQ